MVTFKIEFSGGSRISGSFFLSIKNACSTPLLFPFPLRTLLSNVPSAAAGVHINTVLSRSLFETYLEIPEMKLQPSAQVPVLYPKWQPVPCDGKCFIYFTESYQATVKSTGLGLIKKERSLLISLFRSWNDSSSFKSYRNIILPGVFFPTLLLQWLEKIISGRMFKRQKGTTLKGFGLCKTIFFSISIIPPTKYSLFFKKAMHNVTYQHITK